jgi:hypothetical protein
MLISSVIIVSISFFRAAVAGTVMVDNHGLTGLPMYVAVTAFFVSLGVYAISFYRVWQKSDLDQDSTRILAIILTAIYSLMLPMLSNDIFSLLTYGDAANRGINVYTNSTGLSLSPYFSFINPLWAGGTCIYGPITLTLLKISTMVRSGDMLVSMIVYKVFIFLLSLAFIDMMYRVNTILKVSVRPYIFVVLNPVFLLQSVGQLHSDGIALTFAACMLCFLISGGWQLAFIFAAFAIATKLSFVLLIPFIIVWLFVNRKDGMTFFTQTLLGIGISAVIIGILYARYLSGFDQILAPMKSLISQNPAKSVAEVVGDILYFISTLIGGLSKDLNNSIHAASGAADGQVVAWMIAKKICQLAALLLSAFVFFRFWRGQRDARSWIMTFVRLMLIFLLFYSHVYYVWYLMMCLPFVAYDDDTRFMQWLFVLTCFSHTHDVICMISRDAPVFFIILPVLTILCISVFFWRFRNNFIRSLTSINS